MREIPIVLILIFLGGCSSATGPTYQSLQDQIAVVAKDKARVVFFRTKESGLFRGRSAPIDIDNKNTGACSYGGFFYRDISEGKHTIKTELWNKPGKCELILNARAGSTYYFKVDPRSESAFGPGALLVGGLGELAIEGIESAGKKCGGAFKLYPASEEIAKQQMVGLRQNN